jgi:hypothetical protein
MISDLSTGSSWDFARIVSSLSSGPYLFLSLPTIYLCQVLQFQYRSKTARQDQCFHRGGIRIVKHCSRDFLLPLSSFLSLFSLTAQLSTPSTTTLIFSRPPSSKSCRPLHLLPTNWMEKDRVSFVTSLLRIDARIASSTVQTTCGSVV